MEQANYFQERMDKLGFDPSQHFAYLDKLSDEPYGSKEKRPLFEGDKQGNILIHYMDLNGMLIPLDKSTAKERVNIQPYSRKRLKAPKGEMKYIAPKGEAVYPYLTSRIVAAYQARQHIKRLVVVEGEFKAFAGDGQGLDIVGIGGIHCFTYERQLHPFLAKIIEVCRVEEVVYLLDADCLQITYHPNKDLGKRPSSFAAATNKFKELVSPLGVEVYLAHIQEKHIKAFKGLDDLLQHGAVRPKEALEDLDKLEMANQFFTCHHISQHSKLMVQRIFKIDTLDHFYAYYQNILREQSFVYQGSTYQHDGEKLKLLHHKDTELYMRIGTGIFKKVTIPLKKDLFKTELRKWTKEAIRMEHKKDVARMIMERMAGYNDFCNIPDNTANFQQVIRDCYNLYAPMPHQPQKGDVKNSLYFLSHLVSHEMAAQANEQGNHLAVLLDYLTIIYLHPQQILPILCLVSRENKTGKSTFLKWLQLMFSGNAIILGNQDFANRFNGAYASKLIIGIDEGFINFKDRALKERIKRLATSDTILLENKGVDTSNIGFFGKIIMCSNDEDNFVHIGREEVRWLIFKVPPFKGQERPNLLDDLKAEIPAFLHFLANREIVHPKVTRAWFADKHIRTKQLEKVVNSSAHPIGRDIQEYIKELFLEYELPLIKIDGQTLFNQIKEKINPKLRYSKSDMTKYLREEYKIKAGKPARFNLPLGYDPEGRVFHQKINGRCYEFFAKDWLEEQDFDKAEDLKAFLETANTAKSRK